MPRFTNRSAIVACVVLALTVLGFTIAYFGVKALRVSHRLAIGRMVTIELTQHLRAGGAWPRDKQELSSITGISASILDQCLIVDFQVDLDLLAKQDVDQFTALRPAGPCPNYREYWGLGDLIQSIRQTQRDHDQPLRVPRR